MPRRVTIWNLEHLRRGTRRLTPLNRWSITRSLDDILRELIERPPAARA